MDTIKIENKAVKMVAHRGLSGIEKENTCSAFVAACNRATYFAVETDVHRTVDGQFVIFHDDNTARVGLDHLVRSLPLRPCGSCSWWTSTASAAAST